MNVTFFVSKLESGGMENYLLRYLRYEHDSFNKIYVYCKSGQGGDLEKEYLNIPNLKVVKNKIGYINLISVIELFIFFKSNKINIVCDFTGNFSALTMYTAQVSKVHKRIAQYRSSTDRFKPSFINNLINKILNYLVKLHATDILANSKTGMAYFFGEAWSSNPKFEVIDNGIDYNDLLSEKDNLRDNLNIPESAFVVGHTGRFNEAKNHKVIIEVAKIMVNKYSDIYFILCGKDVKKNLYDQLKLNGISNRVLVFDNRRDIPQFLNTMDCYFFPSITEGQPNSLIEAMIVGLPYVASNIDPIKEIVFDSRSLYPPNDIESFVEALTNIYNERPTKDSQLQDRAIAKFNSKIAFSKLTSRIFNY